MNNSISILSWNLCWGCMRGNPNDISAAKLAEHCSKLPSGKNCLTNVIKNITEKTYDIIGLQEYEKHEVIKNSDYLNKYHYIHSNVKVDGISAKIITFINPNKFTIIATKVGNLNYNMTGARPYQIIFTETNSNKSCFIIVNLHNGKQPINLMPELENTLSMNINKVIKITNGRHDNVEMIDESYDISNYLEQNNFKLIVLGDFNDNIDLRKTPVNFWNGFTPFSKCNFLKLNKLKVNSKNIKPPNTCCTGRSLRTSFHNTDLQRGDYILISNNLEYVIPITIAPINNPSSDHLPVYALITELSNVYNPLHNNTKLKLSKKLNSLVKPNSLTYKKSYYFKIKNKVRLRLSYNYSQNKQNFFGSTLNINDKIIYPNGKIIKLTNTKGKKYYFRYVMSIHNYNKIGYIKDKYLKKINKYQFQVIKDKVRLRLSAHLDNPNKNLIVNNYQHKGLVLVKGDIVTIRPTIINNLIIVQDKYNNNKIGYIKYNKLYKN